MGRFRVPRSLDAMPLSIAIAIAVATSGCGQAQLVVDAGDANRGCLDPCFGHGEPTACCPSPAPDCTGLPDGYPGYACVDPDNPCCSCACFAGEWRCAC